MIEVIHVVGQIIINMLMTIEDMGLQCKEFQSDFAYIVARPLQQ